MMNIGNVLSLFDGMSCGQLALLDAGISYDSYYASEINKYTKFITRKNFPNTIHVGDVSRLKCSNSPKIYLLIGGSPCQDFTFAGTRDGMRTECGVVITTLSQYLELKESGFQFKGSSYLFWEYVRLFNECKPSYFLLENVKMDKKWSDLITSILGVEPVTICSSRFSAQRRKRLYWTNIPIPEITVDCGFVIGDVLEDLVDERYHLSTKHHAAFLRSYKWSHNKLTDKSKPLLASYYKQPPHCPYVECEASSSGFRMLTPEECEKLQTVPVGYTYGVSNTQRYQMIGNGWTVAVISHIFKGLYK